MPFHKSPIAKAFAGCRRPLAGCSEAAAVQVAHDMILGALPSQPAPMDRRAAAAGILIVLLACIGELHGRRAPSASMHRTSSRVPARAEVAWPRWSDGRPGFGDPAGSGSSSSPDFPSPVDDDVLGVPVLDLITDSDLDLGGWHGHYGAAPCLLSLQSGRNLCVALRLGEPQGVSARPLRPLPPPPLPLTFMHCSSSCLTTPLTNPGRRRGPPAPGHLQLPPRLGEHVCCL